jgi:glycine/D-amino acid oxidase-like deaminating enzyme
VVLEQVRIGSGASSRNGGQVLAGLPADAVSSIAQLGRDGARHLYRACTSAIETLESVIRDEQIDCEYTRCGHVQAAAKPSHYDRFKREQQTLAREFGHTTRIVPADEQGCELGSGGYHGLLVDEGSAALHPAKYARGLAQAALRAGAALEEQVEVYRLERDGTRFRVHTSRGIVRADSVLLATNGYTGACCPWLRRRVVPVGSFIIATAPLSKDQAQRILPRRRVAYDSKHFLHYFRLSSDDRLLFGGRAQFTPSGPGSEMRSAEILRRDMIAVFPDLSGVDVNYVWSGNVAFTRDFLPHAGESDGIHYAAGYCGHGIAMATYLGEQVAARMLGQTVDEFFFRRPFKAVPLYNGRPWFLPVVGLWYHVLDILE